MDKEPKNIINLNEGESKNQRGEKLILNGMARDYYQRESIQEGLKDAKENDIILISDLDEIPNLNNFDFLKIKNNIIFFEKKIFYYKLNLHYENFTGMAKRIKKETFCPAMAKKYKRENISLVDLTLIFQKKNTQLNICKGWRLAFYLSKKT